MAKLTRTGVSQVAGLQTEAQVQEDRYNVRRAQGLNTKSVSSEGMFMVLGLQRRPSLKRLWPLQVILYTTEYIAKWNN